MWKNKKITNIRRPGKETKMKIDTPNNVIHTFKFILLIMLYVFFHASIWFLSIKLIPKKISEPTIEKLTIKYYKIAKRFERKNTDTISRLELIEMSMGSMKAKKTRTLITIGGMAIGTAVIVFLVSLGYGVEELIISRIARLDEMKQADVFSQPGSKAKINDQTLSDLKNIPDVKDSLPLIAVVGRVNYQNSVSDMAVFGVTSDYLNSSAIKPIKGKIFESNSISLSDNPPVVTPLQQPEIGKSIRDVNFSINSGKWIVVRDNPRNSANILGYTRRTIDVQTATEVWGEFYAEPNSSNDTTPTYEGFSKWLKADNLLWDYKTCNPIDIDCENENYIVQRDSERNQIALTGYLQLDDITVATSDVLVDETLSMLPSNQNLDFVELPAENSDMSENSKVKVLIGNNSLKQAVVNATVLKVLGISLDQAIGKKFSVTFVVTGDLLEDRSKKTESYPVEYTIVGVTPEDRTPVFYVPFLDLRSLGISNYSQMKVIVKDQSSLAKVRKQIESFGFTSRSVADTVEQINALFKNIRVISALLGSVALSVSALGMFNTLTVSLLERTHEVGLMKALGMKSHEVKELFLTESMIMGFFGGVLGLLLGFIAGELLGFLLSVFSVAKGAGYIDVSNIPAIFVTVIISLSLLVGLITGIYPARRATKISALNALRYE